MVSNVKFRALIFAVLVFVFLGGFVSKPVCASDISDRVTEDLRGADLEKDFTGIEYTNSTAPAMGGAVYNTGAIGDIKGDFTENSAYGIRPPGFGGAVYNAGTIENIYGAFTKNHAGTGGSISYGGALYNTNQIGNIVGDFIQNYIINDISTASGGAIYNQGQIGDITGNFLENFNKSENASASGGAIYNQGQIGNLTGDFSGNYIKSKYEAYGGAIYNRGTIGDIKGAFGENSSTSTETYSSGGAINNQRNAVIGNIEGNFNNNSTESPLSSKGGAISNEGKTGNIIGNFSDNYSKSTGLEALGGAIYNSGETGNIEGNFVRNYIDSPTSRAQGGAIHNEAKMGSISGNFTENKIQSYQQALGGAVSNFYSSVIGDITGNFIDNKAVSESLFAQGGAISNQGTIGNIESNFSGNTAQSNDFSYAFGGALSNDGETGNIKGSFYKNSAKGTFVNGGAIYNSSKMGNVEGSFYENSAEGLKGLAFGGAIMNSAQMGSITGDFVNNHTKSHTAIAFGGALYNAGTMGDINASFEGNSVEGAALTYGGALYNIGRLGKVKGSFINNYAKSNSANSLALGGAVYTEKDMSFSAVNSQIIFSGNYTEDFRGKTPNAIFVRSDGTTTVTLNAENNGEIIFEDQIDGGKPDGAVIDRSFTYNLNLTGDSTGKIVLNNSVINAKVDVKEINLHLGKNDVFANSDFTMHSGGLSLVNGIAQQQIMQSANITGDINMSVDVDLAGQKMDTLAAGTVVDPSAKISVDYLNLLNDANQTETNIFFAPSDYAGQVAYTGMSPIAYSPIWKYNVSYNPQGGSFKFVRSDFNPSVLQAPVATQAGGYTTQMQTFNYAFQHSENFMSIPYLERIAIKNRNRYAFSPTGDATDVGTFSPLLTKHNHNGFWVKPYASFENIPLKNGPKVSNINYGTLIGYDSDLKELSHGVDRVLTGYIGYNGASQRYSGIDTYQNGGVLGGTATLYKGNFFNATTVSVGASAGNSNTMYGSENYTMLLAGIGNKTGYNFEFKEGKVILQPSFLISYTFVNTFDYTNAAGLRIKSDPLNAIQLAPGIKLIGNLKNGWQPYIGVNMVWNLLDKSKVTANDVRLPEMSIKPYVQYGVGLQKCFKEDKMTAYGQAMVNSGGRNGVALSMGFRWKVGK